MLEKLRKIVCKANKDLLKNRLVTSTSGNVSARDIQSGLIAIKPSGYDFEKLAPEHMVIINLQGTVVEGELAPSVDTNSHLYVYKQRQDINSIVHTHSPYATSFAVRGETLPICLTSLAMEFGEHIPVSDYAVIGGEEIGKEIVAKIRECPAILMRNHGVFTVGSSVRDAMKAAIMIEEAARIVHYAMMRGRVNELSDTVIKEAFEFYKEKYGQRRE